MCGTTDPPGPARGWWRRARLAVPLCAVLFLAAASAQAPVSPIAVSARVPVGLDASVVVLGDEAIVVEIRDQQNEISAYQLTGGKLIWTSRLDVLASDVNIVTADGAVIVSMSDMAASGLHTQAFDARTGAHLWDARDGLLDLDDHDDLMLRTGDSDAGPMTVKRVDPRTGVVRWQTVVKQFCQYAFGNDPSLRLAAAFVEMCFTDLGDSSFSTDTPTLRVLDATTGVVKATRVLDLTRSGFFTMPDPNQLDTPELNVWNGAVLVAHANVPQPTVDAFDVATLRPLWHGLAITAQDSLQPCGALLCVYRTNGIEVLDPATGRRLPGPAPFDGARTTGSAYVLVPDEPNIVAAGQLLVAQVPEGISVTVPTWSTGLVWLASVTYGPAAGRSTPEPIQPMRGVGPGACFEAGTYLGCSTSRDELSFWRLPV